MAVLAHEIGHYKMKHVLRSTVLSIIHMGVMFFFLSVFLSHEGLFQAFFVQQPSVYAGLVFFGMLYAPIELVLSIGMQIVSRRHEYEADRFAVDTFEKPALAQALKKLSVHNLANLTPHPFYVFLHYSHPRCCSACGRSRVQQCRKHHEPNAPCQTGGAIAVRSTRVSRDAPRRRRIR